MIRVACSQKGCAFYNKIDGVESSTHCDCAHQQKPLHLNAHPCPLFRLNWNEDSDLKQRASQIIRARRRF